MASELHLGDSNWKFFQVGYPVDTPTKIKIYKKLKINRQKQTEEEHNIAVSPRVGELFCLKPGAKRWCDRSCGARRPANPMAT